MMTARRIVLVSEGLLRLSGTLMYPNLARDAFEYDCRNAGLSAGEN
jgi:hypothetical protein